MYIFLTNYGRYWIMKSTKNMKSMQSKLFLLLSVPVVMVLLLGHQVAYATADQAVQEADQGVAETEQQSQTMSKNQENMNASHNQAELNEQLGFAVWFNNDEEIRNLINQGAEVNALCVVGDVTFYPLAGVLERIRYKQWSSRQKSGVQDFELVKFLVECGADLEKEPSILLLAVMLGNYAIVQFLLDRGLDIEAKASQGGRLLCVFDFLINGIDFGHSYADVMLIIPALVNATVKKDSTIDKNKLTTAVLAGCVKKIAVLMKLEEAAKKFEKRDC